MPAAFLLLLDCGAGDGSTLDDGGRLKAHPYAPSLASRYGGTGFDPSYSGVSQVFFANYCTSCHGGAAPANGLSLEPASAYQSLVGVRSSQRTELFLVEAYQPDRSYLIAKLEGGEQISGRRMPRNRPPRPQDEIDVIRRWIESGALKD
jgi:hypothetical protein